MLKRLIVVLVVLASVTAAFAGGTSTFVEGAYITGGENGRNGAGREDGFEVSGAYGITDVWYVGGVLGTYDRRQTATNDYLQINGGLVRPLTDKADLNIEFGLWNGKQKTEAGFKTDPRAIDVTFRLGYAINEKFSVFGGIGLVAGDLDTPTNDSLRNFVWSAGGAYSFNKHASVFLKVVNGWNGVHGQTDVAKIGFRWTF